MINLTAITRIMAEQRGDRFQPHAAVETGKRQCSNRANGCAIGVTTAGIRHGW
jgi:hypothetical protein